MFGWNFIAEFYSILNRQRQNKKKQKQLAGAKHVVDMQARRRKNTYSETPLERTRFKHNSANSL